VRYFKSFTPDVSVYASGGEVIRWATVDGAVGWYSTARETSVKALLRCIERKVGGRIEEITEEEYTGLAGKAKGAPLFRPEREHISAEGITQPQRVAPAQSGAVLVAAGNAEPVAESDESDSLTAAPAEPEIRKRGGRPRKT
jgi:hypothetical protein